MTSIMLSKELMAPLDRVWDIVGDPDREPEFWHGTKSIRNISKKKILLKEMLSLHLEIPFAGRLCNWILKRELRQKFLVALSKE
jgi:hypothetical protein